MCRLGPIFSLALGILACGSDDDGTVGEPPAVLGTASGLATAESAAAPMGGLPGDVCWSNSDCANGTCWTWSSIDPSCLGNMCSSRCAVDASCALLADRIKERLPEEPRIRASGTSSGAICSRGVCDFTRVFRFGACQ